MKRNKYLEILANLSEDSSTERTMNSKILLVDGLNSFFRAFAANPTVNDNGIHIGGIAGFLNTIGFAIKTLRPTRVVIIFDGPGGSVRRKKLFPEYKANRKSKTRLTRNDYWSASEERSAMNFEIKRLAQYLSYLPVQTMVVRDIEADDAIAYLVTSDFKEHQCIIMSTDNDFLQLVDDRVKVWSPTKRRIYTQHTIIDDFEIPSQNFITYKALIGDKSDNIPGVKGIGLETIKKRLPILLEENEVISLDDVFIYSEKKLQEVDDKGKQTSNYKIYKDILSNKELLYVNRTLMQLADVNISDKTKIIISNQVNQTISKLVKYQLLKLILEDSLGTSIKNPEVWIRETFFDLDRFAEEGVIDGDTKVK